VIGKPIAGVSEVTDGVIASGVTKLTAVDEVPAPVTLTAAVVTEY
jgi:hypothetical protein